MLNVKMETRQFSEELMPVGEHTWEKETFGSWWHRCEPLLCNLHPLIAEQWIYRHYSYTSYSSLPVDRLTWSVEHWSADEITSGVLIPGNEFNPQYDFDVFANDEGTDTGTPFLSTGTWDYPIVTLYSRTGFDTWEGEFPTATHLLIEGHQRMRMLNAMRILGKPMKPRHDVFVLSLPKY